MHHSKLYGWKQMADVTWEGGVLLLCFSTINGTPITEYTIKSLLFV